MKHLRSMLVVAALLAMAAGIALTGGTQQEKKSKPVLWEYRDGANLTVNQMNVLGADGWELVIATQYDKNLYYILKRPKP
jgi:hypothetical protein